jgi:hypothetical protein
MLGRAHSTQDYVVFEIREASRKTPRSHSVAVSVLLHSAPRPASVALCVVATWRLGDLATGRTFIWRMVFGIEPLILRTMPTIKSYRAAPPIDLKATGGGLLNLNHRERIPEQRER